MSYFAIAGSCQKEGCRMFGECHAHLFMNGINYKEAVALHKESVQEKDIREKFQQYKDKGFSLVRWAETCLAYPRLPPGSRRSTALHIAPLYLQSTETATMAGSWDTDLTI